MRRWAPIVSLLFLASSTACPGESEDDDGGSTSPSSGPTTVTDSGSGPDPGTSGEETGAATTSGSSGGSPTTSTSGPGTTGPADDSTSEGGETGVVCEPAPPEGDQCLECVHANCCVAWQACMNDVPCACVVDCHVIQGNSLGMCSNTCNLDSDLYQGLYFCGQGNCLGSCEWDCC